MTQATTASWPLRQLGAAISPIIDATVALSFAGTGYRIHALNFDPKDLDVDLRGRRCAVTGATSGLGLETARALAALGADVLLLCRNEERGRSVASQIIEETGNRSVAVEVVDLSSMGSVRALAKRIGDDPIHVLVHNAGLLPAEREESDDRFELTLATHVFGPHLLTKLLRRNLEEAGGARVIWVSSGGMYTRRLQLEDPNWEERPYDGVVAYAETKRAQVILSELWAEQLRDSGITVNAMHPGWADTPGVQSSLPGFRKVTKSILRTPAQGADTIVWLAASPSAANETGKFFMDRKSRSTHYLRSTRETEQERSALWEFVERATAGDTDSQPC